MWSTIGLVNLEKTQKKDLLLGWLYVIIFILIRNDF